MVPKSLNKPRKLLLFKILLALFIVVNIFSFTRPFSEGKQLYFGKFLLVGLIFILITLGLLTGKKFVRISKATRNISLFFAIWLLFMIIGLFGGFYPISGGLVAFSYIILFLLAFILLPNYLNGENQKLEYKKIFFWSILVSIIASILWGFADSNSLYIVGERVRYQALFHNPNFLGLFSFLGVIVSVGVFALSGKKRYLFSVPFYLTLIYFSDSRAPFFGTIIFAIALFCLWLYSKIKIREERMLLRVLVFLLLLFVFIGGSFITYNCWEYFHEPSYLMNKFLSLRPFYWTRALDGLKNYDWLFGQGLGKEGFGAVSYDNFYLNTLIQTGLLGLFALLTFLLLVFHHLFKSFKNLLNNDYLHRAITASLAIFITIGVYSFFESVLFSLGSIVSIYLWTDIGFCINKKNHENRN